MRNRGLFAFATTLCVFALAAAPALGAKEFKASEVGKEFSPSEPGKEKGAPVGIQDFKFGAFHILCEGAKAKGRIDFTQSKVLFVSVRYKPCYALAKLGTQTIRLQAKFKSPSQTVPLKAEKKPEKEYSSVLYGNEEVAVPPSKKLPSGFQQQLLITNELKGMEYELSEGQCEEFKKTEGKNSFYKGTLKDMVVNGNLSIG
jgi:hypothetical protein